jgi:hypothetical protein
MDFHEIIMQELAIMLSFSVKQMSVYVLREVLWLEADSLSFIFNARSSRKARLEEDAGQFLFTWVTSCVRALLLAGCFVNCFE